MVVFAVLYVDAISSFLCCCTFAIFRDVHRLLYDLHKLLAIVLL